MIQWVKKCWYIPKIRLISQAVWDLITLKYAPIFKESWRKYPNLKVFEFVPKLVESFGSLRYNSNTYQPHENHIIYYFSDRQDVFHPQGVTMWNTDFLYPPQYPDHLILLHRMVIGEKPNKNNCIFYSNRGSRRRVALICSLQMAYFGAFYDPLAQAWNRRYRWTHRTLGTPPTGNYNSN